MSKKLVLPDHDLSIDLEDAGFDQRLSYNALLDYFKTTIPIEDLKTSVKKFEDEKERLNKVLKQSLGVLREQPLVSAFLIWSKGNSVKSGYPDYAKILIEKDILRFRDEKRNLLIIKDLKEKFFVDILESIRCRKDIDIWEREMLVLSFKDFVNWMWATTRFSAFDIKDRDKETGYRRFLNYDDFIRFLGKLDDRCQLVAKLLYFGGSRTLAEVLNIELKDINFVMGTIDFGAQHISYPRHVLEDIKILTKDQKTGKIFAGRKKTSLNAATIFRNFKEASLKLGLEDVYTPKILTTDS